MTLYMLGTLALLHDCDGVQVRVWRPRDWPEIEETLGGRND